MTDPATDATPAERREALSWCLRTFILPPDRRVAVETRIAGLRTGGLHLHNPACRAGGYGGRSRAP